MRVLFISDVYFPRVNGVSTSIRTFRTDLASAGVETVLVAPAYGATRSLRRPTAGVIRVPRARAAGSRRPAHALARCARRSQPLAAQHFDLVHIHTPFLAHYAGHALRAPRACR
jgi:1,2-diacylglycerol 3-alpha-glucosyltransferase